MDNKLSLAKQLFSERKYDQAYKLFKEEERSGGAYVNRMLGIMNLLGLGVDIDEHLALSYFLKAASEGDIEAMFSSGKLYYKLGECNKSYSLLTESHQLGFPPSTFLLGWLCLNGHFDTCSSEYGLGLIKAAAAKNHIKALGYYFRLLIRFQYGFFGFVKSPYILVKLVVASFVVVFFGSEEDERLLY